MTPKLKKIIAREGTIILGIMLVLYLSYPFVYYIWDFFKPKYDFDTAFWGDVIRKGTCLSYVFYLLIRFIIWAIKTLKNRKNE